MIWQSLLWALITYLIASIPYSVIIGRLVAGVDIRDYGDGNPGATNVKRATGSMIWFLVALLFDGFKGLFPVGIPYHQLGWTGFEIVPVALAAILGHAFPVFLGFRGGKSVAITGGVWIGLIILEAALVIPLMLTYWFYAVEESEWSVLLMMLSLLLYLLLTRGANYPLLAIWLGNFSIVVYRHRAGLGAPPTLRPPFWKRREA